MAAGRSHSADLVDDLGSLDSSTCSESSELDETDTVHSPAEPDQSRAAATGNAANVDEGLLQSIHDQGLNQSCKTRFTMALLDDLVATGHRTLVFSQSLVMLDILSRACRERRWRTLRLDGSVSSTQQRAAIVARFQRDPTIPVCLLSSQVGGLGLTLTAADRVVVIDPAWNPATDNQAVDRAYRVGQDKHVLVYRLITCGSVEEKMYRRQVFKGGLMRSGTQAADPTRYFSYIELRDLFVLKPQELMSSATQADLSARHSAQRVRPPGLDEHLAALERLPNYVGVSDHDLLFSTSPARNNSAIGGTSLDDSLAPPRSAAAAAVAAHFKEANVSGVASWRDRGGGDPIVLTHPSGSGNSSTYDALTKQMANGLQIRERTLPTAQELRQQRVQELTRQLNQAQQLLQNSGMLKRLSDGGDNIRKRIGALGQQLSTLGVSKPLLT